MKKIFVSQNNSLRAMIAVIATIGIVGTTLATGIQLVSLLNSSRERIFQQYDWL